ncbi:type II and III secretion system protein [Nautilia profundicola AmH]|uniref:Type II and III secretion system protein n=1 Tax=Nautilia profundicola (strain ATCC BAA-1463 / DSM 18972 / AmH) TaxID=598659 RepID=B9L5X9_NAUPA|nr:type II protein secretion system protein D [Nautilia profundicola]ACM93393.1 type II and III secretion system protein [Nautilia profundicola AmH]
MKKLLILILFITSMFATDCDKKLFSLHIANPVNFKMILSDLVNECKLNIVLKDKKAKKMINQNLEFINVENVSFKELLNTLFQHADLFYELKNNTLIVSYNKTKTFRVDFIPNSISGISNIDSTDNTIKTDYKFDFWDNLKNNIIQILKNTNPNYKEPIIDKNSGLVTVTGDRNQIEEIDRYINDLNNRLHKEVLIDVKIYSVTLSSSHKTGIDWSQLSLSLADKSVPITASNIIGANAVFKEATFNVGGLLNFLAQNGNVNSISNPKIVTLNNQKALIKVGDTIYYKYASEITTDNNGNPTTEYTIDSKFVGVLLDITPQISDNGEIILSINPRISAFKDATQLSNVNRDMPPDTQDNTMISVVKLKDNDTLVLGGLITDDKQLKVNGVPVLKEIPIIKYLFSSREEITTKKELVFVITPHIIDLKQKKTLRDYGYKKLPSLEDLNVR